MLCAIPAIRSLRHAFPQAEIVLIGLPWATSFVQRFNLYFNRCIVFPGYPGLPEQPFSPAAWEQFKAVMEQEQFDMVLQMQGNGSIVNDMLLQLPAKQLAGFYRRDRCPDDPRLPLDLFVAYPEGKHEIERHLILMKHLGIPDQGTDLEFPIHPEEEAELERIAPFAKDTPYVCVHPGSRDANRQWPPAYFAKLADHCAANGYRVVLTGTKDELHIVDNVIQHMQYQPVNLAGKTALGVVAALIQKSRLLISNCTGVSHIAAATRTPSFIISMDGEPERWGPLNRSLHLVTDWLQHPYFDELFEQFTTRVVLPQKAAHAMQ
jgi:ADP-heptose:LPS heptosyltransferase